MELKLALKHKTRVIVIANRKGGVGKTTAAFNLGAAYALQGRRVCFIDLDSQGNLSMLCSAAAVNLDDFKAVKIHDMSDRLSILPASKSFPALENELSQRIDRNGFLRDDILPYVTGFEYIIIDTSPSLSVLNINALCVADMVHILVNADSFSLSGLVEMRTILQQVRAINPALDYRIVLNAAHKGRNMSAAAIETLRAEPNYAGIEIPNRQHVVDSNARRIPALDMEDIRIPFVQLAEVL